MLQSGGTLVLEVTNRRSLARFGYRHAPISLCTLDEVRGVGRRCGLAWTDAVPGAHLPYPLWNAAHAQFMLSACIHAQRSIEAVLGPTAARSVFLVGHKLS